MRHVMTNLREGADPEPRVLSVGVVVVRLLGRVEAVDAAALQPRRGVPVAPVCFGCVVDEHLRVSGTVKVMAWRVRIGRLHRDGAAAAGPSTEP